MNQKRKTISILGIALSISVVFGSVVSAELVPIGDEPTITLDPTEPIVQSPITFTATFTSEDARTNVRIVVQECTENQCYLDKENESMTLTDINTYQGTVTLQKTDATYISYHIELESNGMWYVYSPVNVTLKPKDNTNGNGNGTNGNGNHIKTPGFELVLLLIAISFAVVFSVLYMKRKRL